MIKIYSTPTCPWCKKAKAYLESKNIPFEDINVAEDLEKEKKCLESLVSLEYLLLKYAEI